MSALAPLILVPALGGLIVLFIPRGFDRLRGVLALIAAIGTSVHATRLFVQRSAGPLLGGMEAPLLELGKIDLSLALRMDGLSSFIVLAASVLTALVVLYSLSYMAGRERLREYYTYVLWVLGGANAALVADNLLLLLISWEIVTLLLFLLITLGGGAARDGAGKTFVMIGASDCALLLGVVLLGLLQGTVALSACAARPLVAVGTLPILTYLLFLVAALTKAGAMPFHTWIPKAAEGAPTSVMAFLPAALDKLLGIYLLARIALFLFEPSDLIRLALLIVGAATVLLAVMAALVQHDLKKLLSLHAVSQVGYMVLGIGTGVPIGVVGGLFHMLNNAIYKCCLFLGAGAVEKQAGTTDMDQLGGLAKTMPVTFVSMLVAALAISGVPPLNGFASKWLVYQGLMSLDYGGAVFLLAALFGSALTLASFVKVVYSLFLGQRPPALASVRDADWSLKAPIALLALACVLLGVFAQVPVASVIEPAVGRTTGLAATVPGAMRTHLGLWSPTLGAVLLLAGVGLAAAVYALGTVAKARRTTVFVGGESFTTEEMRVSGPSFYQTIRQARYLRTLYDDAAQGAYDLYVLFGRCGQRIVDALRGVHDGVLGTYLGFCALGLLILLWALVRLG